MSRIRKIVQTTNAIEIQFENGSTTLIQGGGPTRMAAIAQTLKVGDEYNPQSPQPVGNSHLVINQPTVLKDQFGSNANELFQRQLSAVFNQSHSPSAPPVLKSNANHDPELDQPYAGLVMNWSTGEIEHIGGGAMPSGELPPPRRGNHVDDYSGAAGGPILHEDFEQFSPAVQFALQRAHDRGGAIPFVDDPELNFPYGPPTMNFEDRNLGSQPTANRQQQTPAHRQPVSVTNGNDDLDVNGYSLPSLDFSDRR